MASITSPRCWFMKPSRSSASLSSWMARGLTLPRSRRLPCSSARRVWCTSSPRAQAWRSSSVTEARNSGMVMASASSISLPVAVRLPCTCAPCSSASWCSWRAFSRACCSSRTARSRRRRRSWAASIPGRAPACWATSAGAVPEQRLDLQLQLGQARHGLFRALPGLLHVALDPRALRLQVEGAALQLLQVALQGVPLGPGRGAHPGGLHQDPALLLQRPLGLLPPGLHGLDGLGEPGFLRAAFGHFQGPQPGLERRDLALQQFPLGVGPLLGFAGSPAAAPPPRPARPSGPPGRAAPPGGPPPSP